MARLLQSLRRVLGLTTSKPAPPAFARSLDTNFSFFRGKLLLDLGGNSGMLIWLISLQRAIVSLSMAKTRR